MPLYELYVCSNENDVDDDMLYQYVEAPSSDAVVRYAMVLYPGIANSNGAYYFRAVEAIPFQKVDENGVMIE